MSDSDDGFYDDIEDGDGCAEIWERLSERRKKDRERAEQESQD